jgi:peptide/nickel transport system substrate-binding protein
MFDTRLAGGALDYAGFHTAPLDSLFVRATRAETDADLAAVWRQVQVELASDVPVSWIYHARGVQGLSRKLHEVRMDLRGEMATLARWRLDTPRAGS